MPIISIVIPVYNSEKYIAKTLDSVLDQTFKDFEIICIDDGSTDSSREILLKYSKIDDRIVVIFQKNQGVVVSRNNGILNSKSDYIYTLDSDDIIDRTLLEKFYSAIVSGKGDVITCRVALFGECSNREFMLLSPTKRNMAYGNCLVNAALFKKEFFFKSGGFDLSFQKGLEDYDFYLNLLYRHNAVFYRIPEILFYYRIKPVWESRNKKAAIECKKELQQCIENKYPELKDYRSFWGWGLYYTKRQLLSMLGRIKNMVPHHLKLT